MNDSSLPSLSFDRIIRAFQRDGWVIVRQRGSHIRLQKHTRDGVLKLTIPAHKPVKKSTPSAILKQIGMTADQFNALL